MYGWPSVFLLMNRLIPSAIAESSEEPSFRRNRMGRFDKRASHRGFVVQPCRHNFAFAGRHANCAVFQAAVPGR